MIIISCRIMIAIRSRSTMEFGRRISTTTQKQMKQVRSYTNASLTRHENQSSVRNHTKHIKSDNVNGQATSISIAVNPFDSIPETPNIPSNQSDDDTESSLQTNHQDKDDNDSLYHCPSRKPRSIGKRRFSFAHLKPITILFPSLSSIKEYNIRKSEDVPKQNYDNNLIKSSHSVSNDMKYSDRQFNRESIKLDHIPRTTSSTTSLSDECLPTIFSNRIEQQTSLPMRRIPV
jgi:hypothetical protein